MVKWFHKIENIVAFTAVFLLALLPFMQVIARIFKTSVPYASDYMHHLVLVITFIGGMITSREGKHLSLSLALKIEDPLKTRIHTGVMLISAMMTTAFCWSALSFLLEGIDPSKKIGIFPLRLIGLVMIVGYAIMAVRFVTRVPKGGWHRVIAASGLLVGTFIALDPIAKIIASFYEGSPGFIEPLLQFAQSANAIIALPIIILLIISAIFGAPLFVVLGGIAYLLFARMGEPLGVIANESYEMLISHSIPAIPLFTVAGFLLSESKAGERLVRFFKAFFAWFPGGLAIMAILVCAFFTTFTGASGVTILALGALLSYVLINGRYERKFSVGLLTGSGSVGLLFPPSLPIIIYGVIAGVSIKDMFIGGVVPGFVLVLTLVVFSIIYASKHKTERQPFKVKEALSGIGASIWEILLPIVIILVYFGGLANLEESAAIAVIYAFVVEVFIKRDLKIRDLTGVVSKSVPIIGGILIILSLAKGLSYYIVDAQVPMKLTEWVQASITSKYVFLLLLNIGLLITGCFMDIFSAIMVVVPLIIPLGNLFGIHPVHLGIIFLANMELGYMTPPVGLNLFLSSYRFNEPMGKLYKDVLPFFLIQLAAVLLITYLPFLSTGLLKLFN
ncbi:MAG: TRAP transporter large permease subunit [Candidatus Aminicenantes bacterium]|nr:MAG: TRAP transporter large permease subunit [Candidatus Aminicenantes bacterium]